jgi:hypothetical protein
MGLADLAATVTELRPAGPGRLRGLCPFHSERSPSFFVFEARDRWRCFGCNEGGDAVDFVRRTRGCGYREALKLLGRDDPKATAATLRELARKRRERAQAEWREREVAWTLGNAIRIAHGVLRRATPENLDDFALILQELPTLEHQHQILIAGTPADRAAVLRDWSGVQLFPRTRLWKTDFDYRGWLSGISPMEPRHDGRPGRAAGDTGRTAIKTS